MLHLNTMKLRLHFALPIVLFAATGCVHAPVELGIGRPLQCADLLTGEAETAQVVVIAEDTREVPLTVLWPATSGNYPLIAFSHGAFAAPPRYEEMLQPLAASGYVIIAPMHVDSELFDHGDRTAPDPNAAWTMRNEDMALALSAPESVRQMLREQGVTVDASQSVAMGHSYGALMAQLAGGALARDENGVIEDVTVAGVDAIVAWSPPGPLPGRIEPVGWQSMNARSMVITGTADILPGFIDDWRLHSASYDNAPEGTAKLWVGEGVDHYFGGVFGRPRPADAASQAMFARAMQQTLAFMEDALEKPHRCMVGTMIEGESIVSN